MARKVQGKGLGASPFGLRPHKPIPHARLKAGKPKKAHSSKLIAHSKNYPQITQITQIKIKAEGSKPGGNQKKLITRS